MMILDACCGAMKIWHGWDKQLDGQLVTIDRRTGDFSVKYPSMWGKTTTRVMPTVCSDMKSLPFRDSQFDLIVWDPPHLEVGHGRITQQQMMSTFLWKAYGSWSLQETVLSARAANEEFRRVLKSHGSLLLKTAERRLSLSSEIQCLISNSSFQSCVVKALATSKNLRYGSWGY